jgi:hypothetical protein
LWNAVFYKLATTTREEVEDNEKVEEELKVALVEVQDDKENTAREEVEANEKVDDNEEMEEEEAKVSLEQAKPRRNLHRKRKRGSWRKMWLQHKKAKL